MQAHLEEDKTFVLLDDDNEDDKEEVDLEDFPEDEAEVEADIHDVAG